jgi:heptosyltransferase-2
VKILIVRFSSIGDIILTTPVVRCLHSAFPDAEIHYFTRRQYRDIVATLPSINKVISFENNINEVIADLKQERYTHIIDLHKNLRTKILLLKMARCAHSFPKLNLRKWLKVRLKADCLPDIHIVDRYLKSVAFLNVKNDGLGLDFIIPTETSLPENLFLPDKPYTVIVAGAKQFTKQIPESLILNLCREIKGPKVLIGGRDEMEKSQQILAKAKDEEVTDLCGKLNLYQSALILRDARNIITADTGMMHLAAALKKEVISIWGNTIPEFGMYAYYPQGMQHYNHMIENNNLKCRPCSKLGYSSCPKKHFKCMNDLHTEDILKFIK